MSLVVLIVALQFWLFLFTPRADIIQLICCTASLACVVWYCYRQKPRRPLVIGAVAGAAFGVMSPLLFDTWPPEWSHHSFLTASVASFLWNVLLGSFLGIIAASCWAGPGSRLFGLLLFGIAGFVVGHAWQLLFHPMTLAILTPSAAVSHKVIYMINDQLSFDEANAFVPPLLGLAVGLDLWRLPSLAWSSRSHRVAALCLVLIIAASIVFNAFDRSGVHYFTYTTSDLVSAEDARGLVYKARYGDPLLKLIRDPSKKTFTRIPTGNPYSPLYPHARDERDTAVRALSLVESKSDAEYLLSLLDSGPENRRLALLALVSIGERRAQPLLVGILRNDSQNEAARARAANDLGMLIRAAKGLTYYDVGGMYDYSTGAAPAKRADVPAERALLAALEDQSPVVRRAAADGLGHMRSLSAIPGLVSALRDDDRMVRRNCADALGEICDKRSLPYLRAAQGESSGECSVEIARVFAAVSAGVKEGHRPFSYRKPIF